ncbi:MAG: sugar phosphate isomerase/epimerase family protein [Candidatus Latescibacterota bacterium]
MKIGYCLWGMPKVALEESLPRLAEMGYQGVEMTVCPGWSNALDTMTPERRREVRRFFADTGMTLTAVAAHQDIMGPDLEAVGRNMQFLRDAMDLAAELAQPVQTPIMVSLVGGRPEQWPADRALLSERVAQLARDAGQRGVIYATEMHTGTIMDVPSKAVQIVDEVNHPALKMNFDQSHTETMGIPIEEAVARIGARMVHTHVKDQRGLWPDHEFLTPGEGPCDYVRYLRAMDQAGYRGFINAEVSVMRQRKPDYEPFVHAAFAYRVLDLAFQAAGVVRQR